MQHFSFSAAVTNLHVSPKTEIYLDFSIKNAGFVFAVEILCDFSVFTYNLYSFNKFIVVKLNLVQKNLKMLAKNCQT